MVIGWRLGGDWVGVKRGLEGGWVGGGRVGFGWGSGRDWVGTGWGSDGVLIGGAEARTAQVEC